MICIRDSLRHTALIAAAAIVSAGAAHANSASPWSNDIRSSARIIAGNVPRDSATLRAGIEVKLQPGWKTYWRYPGDSGVPPQFDFAGSENLASAEVLYPAPHSFQDGAGTSIGYEETVVFPVRVTPRDPSKPVKLNAKIDYAVCEKLCIPAEGKAQLVLERSAAANDVLTAAEARVPKPVPAGEIALKLKRAGAKPKPLVTLEVAAPEGEAVEVFVEGPGKDWALPIPKVAQGAPKGHRHFSFEFDGLPPGADPMGKYDLTFTVVTPTRAFEATTRLD
jgi:DsbC/DsbD-like thiol-disulfide interchange protein